MSFNTALSGLNAAAKNLDVVGHNIANSNTVGMKSSRAEFSEVFASSLGAGGGGGGIGVSVSAVTQQFTQGNINVTGNELDLAINGGGFFVTELENGTRAYTRAGNFKLDNQGYIVTNAGAKLVDPRTGQPLNLPTGAAEPGDQTSLISLELNLDTRKPVYQNTIDNPREIGTSVQVFDAQGAPVNVDLYFVKKDSNNWNVFANYPKSDGDATSPQGVYPLNNQELFGDNAGGDAPTGQGFIGNVQFNSDGSVKGLNGVALNGGAALLSISNLQIPGGATNPFNIDIDLTNISQNAQAFTVTALEQDGQAPGQLTGIQVESNGEISARYSNGKTKTSAQVLLANFRNVTGLSPVSGGYWIQTAASGDPAFSEPGSGNFGSLRSGALEDSNVDLTSELVNMMTAQRSYQANAQTIKTQDQVLSTLMNLR